MNKPKTLPRKIVLSRNAKERLRQLWYELLTKMITVKSKERLGRILGRLISENEQRMILKRLAVMTLIESGKSYKEISRMLWLSPNTVSAIKKNISEHSAGYKNYYHWSRKNKWVKTRQKPSDQFLNDIGETLKTLAVIFRPFMTKYNKEDWREWWN